MIKYHMLKPSSLSLIVPSCLKIYGIGKGWQMNEWFDGEWMKRCQFELLQAKTRKERAEKKKKEKTNEKFVINKKEMSEI